MASRAPNTDPPFYFRRTYTGESPMDEVTIVAPQPDGTVLVLTSLPRAMIPPEIEATIPEVEIDDPIPDGLVIYGRAIDPPGDHDYVVRMREHGLIFSDCYSEVCMDGEVGTHPLATLTEISADEFEAARARGWKEE